MKEIFFVLWLFQPTPWSFHGIPLSEGWFSHYTYQGKGAYADCMVAKTFAEKATYKALCLKAGVEPEGKISEVIRNVK